MSGIRLDRKLVAGVLCGMGLGLASAAILCPRWRSRLGEALLGAALVVADRLGPSGGARRTRSDRRADLVGRRLSTRIERMRSAGF